MVNDDIIIYMYYENRTRSRPTQRSAKKKSAVSFIYILLVVIWIITVALYLKDSPKCKLLFLS